MTGAPFGWGIVGAGNIASQFTRDLALSKLGGRVVAVGSRSRAKAEAFAERFGIGRAYASYEELVADGEVEAVYVALANPFHHRGALLALRGGKPALVEKPFTVNAAQAAELVGLARSEGLFLMEGMWTRCLPHMRTLRGLLDGGVLGSVRLVVAEHGIWFPPDPGYRIYDPDLAGGALLDLGVYVLSLASLVYGPPDSFEVVSVPAPSGVDAQTSLVLSYASGATAVLSTSIDAQLPNRAVIAGTEARVVLEGTWYRPTALVVTRRDGSSERIENEVEGGGLRFEAEEVARCVRAGLTESPLVPLDESLAILETMDEVRRRIGLRYPFEDAGRAESGTWVR
ncbi:MAG TPA: Gfo/Idh/MocA family oxidoreductase [Acidimicrobiales bacterium]|nr:Gfo/Idh/MocA family oxidoreductase [Acidimicrobiales bacterium]